MALAVSTVTIEMAAGIAFGPNAPLADGLHMASCAVALAISASVCACARRLALEFPPRFAPAETAVATSEAQPRPR